MTANHHVPRNGYSERNRAIPPLTIKRGKMWEIGLFSLLLYIIVIIAMDYDEIKNSPYRNKRKDTEKIKDDNH